MGPRGRPAVLTERQKAYVREELAKGVSQRELSRVLEGEPVEDPSRLPKGRLGLQSDRKELRQCRC